MTSNVSERARRRALNAANVLAAAMEDGEIAAIFAELEPESVMDASCVGLSLYEIGAGTLYIGTPCRACGRSHREIG